MIYAESRFDADVESSAGAVGLMQLLPETAKGIALRTGGAKFVVSDLRDPEINVRYGSWYLDHLRERYDGDMRLALAAYHAGQGNVDRWLEEGGGIAFPETRAYVDEVERVTAGVRAGVSRRAPPIASRSSRSTSSVLGSSSPPARSRARPFRTRLTNVPISFAERSSRRSPSR